MKSLFFAIAILLTASLSMVHAQDDNVEPSESGSGLWKGTMKSIDGHDVDLSQYKGKVVVVVNVASRCGFTKQYAALEELWNDHQDDGLVVLGFPCNQFGKQEPGSSADIKEFCSTKFNVSFDMFEKSDVNGENRNAVYAQLCPLKLEPKGAGDVKWNFEKFIVGKDGVAVARFPSRVAPGDEAFLSVVKSELEK